MRASTIVAPARLAGVLLVLSFVLVIIGALMFVSQRGVDQSELLGTTRFAIERGFIMIAVIATAAGFLMLEESERNAQSHTLVSLGAMAYFFGAVLIVTFEAIRLSEGVQVYSLVVIYVLLALSGQAAIGAGLTQTTSFPQLIGWITLAWSVMWLIILPLATPGDVYFPVLQHLMPLIIGVPLLVKG
jgi:hypothetical protein